MKIAINYADEMFISQQKFNTKTAYKNGKVDKVIEYKKNDIDSEFKQKYSSILTQKRGGGYWLWKPYIIKKTLEKVQDGDYIIYCDSGAYYVGDVNGLIEVMDKYKCDIMPFELPLIEKQWTKTETFIKMDCEDNKFKESNQILATYLVIKKSSKSIQFIDKYLNYCTDIEIIGDSINETIQDDSFIDHRHDQSIFSLLCKKENLITFRDPSQYGNRPWEYAAYNRLIKYKKYENSSYDRIFMSQRNANIKKFMIKEKIKDYIFKFGIIKYRKYE